MAGPIIVLKIGGGRDVDHEAVFSDLKLHIDAGNAFVVVHGANYEMDRLSERLGKPPVTLHSVSGYVSRYSDPETMDIFKMVYCGLVNTSLVELCQRRGINAVGLSGVDGALLRGERKKALRVVENGKKRIVRDDYSGKIEAVNVELLRMLVGSGYLPLISPPALSEESEAINVDGDRAAARIAAALGAERLVILSNVPGLLRDVSDETSLISEIRRPELQQIEDFAQGRMRKKTMAAAEAIDGGVSEVILGDARRAHPIREALGRRGTWIH